MKEFKDRLKILRNERDLYQKDLAKLIGVSDGAIAMYETGKRTPDKDILDKLASLFDVSVDYLLGRVEERSSADKIKSALAGDPELAGVWDKLSKRPDLQLLFKQTKDMSPEGVRQIIRIIQAIEKEEQEK